MVVDVLDFVQSIFYVFLVKKLFFHGWDAADLYEILKHKIVNRLCRVSHENFTIELRFFDKVRKSCAVVHMKMRDEQQLNFFWVDAVEVGQLLHTFSSWMQPTVQHDLSAFALKVDTAASYFAARAQRSNFQDLATLCLYLASNTNLQFA